MYSYSKPSVRLNLRTRSIEHLQKRSSLDDDGSACFYIGPASPIHQSRKSIMKTSPPSRIPRLSLDKKEMTEDITEYLDLDLDKHASKKSTPIASPVAEIIPKVAVKPLTVDNVRVLQSNFRSSSDASTQVNFPAPIFSPRSDSPESRPVERQIEARSGSEDGLGSMVRCLHFASTFIASRKFKMSLVDPFL